MGGGSGVHDRPLPLLGLCAPRCLQFEHRSPPHPRLTHLGLAQPIPCCSALHHRDFAASLDYLHRFFDHTVDLAGPGSSVPPAAGGGAAGDAAAAAARERGRLQSAALSLGSMHAQLGHIEEAMQALNETVRWWE